MNRMVLVVLVTILVAAGDAQAQRKVDPQHLAGCYTLHIGDWSRPVPDVRLPPIVKLDTIPIVTFATQTSVDPWPEYVAYPAGDALTARWHPFSATRFTVLFAGDHGAIAIVASLDGNELSGRVEGTLDQKDYPVAPRAKLSGLRVPCPSSWN